jgi:hypothetical protein
MHRSVPPIAIPRHFGRGPPYSAKATPVLAGRAAVSLARFRACPFHSIRSVASMSTMGCGGSVCAAAAASTPLHSGSLSDSPLRPTCATRQYRIATVLLAVQGR